MLLLLLNGSKDVGKFKRSWNALFLLLLHWTLLFGVAFVEVPLTEKTDLLSLSFFALFCDTMYTVEESDFKDFIEPMLALF